jgi:competence protein ComEA
MLKKILALLAMLYAAASFAAVDVNKATAAELDGVKGIGPAISGKIVEERKKGDFKDWQDFIDRVKGVGDKNAARFSAEGLTVNGAAFKGAPAKTEDKKAAAKTDKTAAMTSAAASAPKADMKPAAAASAAKDEKKDAKAEAQAKKEADKKAKAEEKAKKAEEAKAKKEEAKAKKAAAKEAKPAASAASAKK